MENKINCCSNPDLGSKLNKEYWGNQYLAGEIGWDLGKVSPPIQAYIDTLENKKLRILIPGAGNSYEAEYLLAQGFENVTVLDYAKPITDKLKEKFKENSSICIVCDDFFNHIGEYDLILEQTFFCALLPDLRSKYVHKMHELLALNGQIVGVMFNREFDKQGPPFGGNKEEYITLFNPLFKVHKLEPCYNSVAPRMGSEVFVRFSKKNENE
jgi:hypothetical protein